MRVDATISYVGADPRRVFTMLIDPEFQRRKCAATGATSYDVDITAAGDRTVITCRRTLPTTDLPEFVRPFVGSGLVLVETIDWAAPDTDGSRLGDVRLVFTGQPLSMTGQLRMSAAGADTVANLIADLKAAVPLLGGRIEKACEPLVHKALQIEERLGAKWLAEHQ